ncbi:MAG: GyrI-like domain-containing protein [Planctomycetes bacterium]|jgi:effector-binding domain-containing protein|nr:GyrI-like domain-containing protein [Planctomycetota bacterium]
MDVVCGVKAQAAQCTLVVRTKTAVQELPAALGKTYAAIGVYLAELGERPAGPPFVAYHNRDMACLDVEIGFPVARPLPSRGEILPGSIPAGRVASCIYTGPYAGMAPAYEALAEWMEENGYEACGIAYEIYWSDPARTRPEKLKTQIVFPIA